MSLFLAAFIAKRQSERPSSGFLLQRICFIGIEKCIELRSTQTNKQTKNIRKVFFSFEARQSQNKRFYSAPPLPYNLLLLFRPFSSTSKLFQLFCCVAQMPQNLCITFSILSLSILSTSSGSF